MAVAAAPSQQSQACMVALPYPGHNPGCNPDRNLNEEERTVQHWAWGARQTGADLRKEVGG